MLYNLEVQQDHTFTVGNGLWVVHNDVEPCDLGLSGTVEGHYKQIPQKGSTLLDENGQLVQEQKWDRPYIQTPQTMSRMIMESGEPQSDKFHTWNSNDIAIEFATDIVAVLHQKHLKALWLKPLWQQH